MKQIHTFNYCWILSQLSIAVCLLSLAFIGQVHAQDEQPKDPAKLAAQTDQSAKTALNEKLAKYLTGTRWEGKFTITGKDTPPTSEYYEITKAEKGAEGDYWNLIARIKYGKNDTTLPLPPLEIKWAGETPVITVDKLTIPGMGTFDARVVIRQGKYAGTWSHDEVGGHLFGTIEKIEAVQPGEEKATVEPTEKKTDTDSTNGPIK